MDLETKIDRENLLLKNEEILENKGGRHRLSPEDRAKPLSIKLYNEHLEKLEYVPGDNNSKKIRFLLDNFINIQERERKQVKEISRRISPIATLARGLYKPEIKNNPTKYQKVKDQFIESCDALISLIDILSFTTKELVKYLNDRDISDLNTIYMMRGVIRASSN
jgi:hypothetical protein